MAANRILYFFGDSITYGEWDEQGGWANRVRSRLDAKVLPLPGDYHIVYNLGIPGDVSTNLLNRLVGEIESRLAPLEYEVDKTLIFAIGTNDAACIGDSKKHTLEIKAFAKNIEKIIQRANTVSDDIAFVGLLPCNEVATFHTASRHAWVETFDNRSLSQYNAEIRKICGRENVLFIDVYDTFKKNNPSSLLNADGLHPNAAGHNLIANTVLDSLIANRMV